MNEESGIGFYQTTTTSFTLGANTAYLPSNFAPAPGGARAFYGFDEDPTSIGRSLRTVEQSSQTFYDLQGRKVTQPTRGLYIVNGKKVVIK